MSTLFLDFETRSEANLKKVGPWAYSEHPSTEVICACWAVGKSKVARWGNPAVGYAGWPEASAEALVGLVRDTDLPIEAHNVAFEISIWENVCHKRMGWPRIPIERWRDTMALASYYSLPPALDNLCRVLGLAGKVREGANLIQRYSKLNLKHAQRTIPPEDLKLWLDYCANDVDQERQAAFLLGELPEEEEKVFLHDLAVGMRGLRLDPAGVEGARRVVEQRAGELEAEFNRLTGLNPGQRDRVLEWFEGRGLKLPDLTAETLDDLLDEGKLNSEPIVLAPELRRPLEIRRSHSKASTKKLDAMLAQVGTDGCARFQTRYHGAVTGRNTGTGFQPLNLNRGYGNVSPEQLVRDIGVGDARWLDAVYGDAMEAVGKASRHWITARPGSRIMSGDYTSVEAVVLACLAGEEWKIQAFRDNQPIYEMGACSIYGWPAERAFDPDFKKKWGTERQDGKVRELACGYQGALGAWRNFDNSDRHSDEKVIEMVRSWRNDHPRTRDYWRGLEDACIEAVMHPGRVTGYDGQELFQTVDNWLTMILPDGKRLWYWHPQLKLVMPSWHEPGINKDCTDDTCKCRPRLQVCYEANKSGRWRRVYTYGGKLTENRVQAVSRQLLKPVEIALERRGYPVVLSVYDEVVCDVPNNFGSTKEFAAIVEEALASLPWASGWPIRMDEPWEGQRYRK